MARNTFATFGILAILLLSVGIVSAYSIEKVGVNVTVTTELANPIGLDTTNDMVITIINNNGSTIDIKWFNVTGGSGTTWTTLPANGTLIDNISTTYTATLSVPADFALSTTRNLKLEIYEFGTTELIATFNPGSALISSLYVPDTTIPIITLLGNAVVNITIGDTYTDEGATATDTEDGDLTSDIVIGGDTVDTSTIGTYTITYDVEDDADNSAVQVIRTVQVIAATTPTPSPTTSWCKEEFNGEHGYLEITNVDITNLGQGDDDAWEYLDKIEIEITVENTDNDDSVDDVIIEIEIRDENNNVYSKKTFDLDDLSEDVGRIKSDGDEETVTFTIDEVPIDLDDRTYRLYVRAYEDGNEDEQCVSESDDLENDDNDETYFQFDVEASRDSAIIVKNNLENIQASCGDKNVEVTFRVYNTGNDKEDKVLVNLYNGALGIDEYIVIDNLKDEKNKEVTFFMSIPEDIQKKSATLDIFLHYDYEDDEDDEDEFSYDKSSDDEGSDFEIGLEIISCTGAAPSINANLDSTAEVGEELIVKAIITNNGNDDNDFVISISNFETWADIVSVTPQTASIKEGEFIEVIVVLKPHTAGTQSFTINAIVDGESYNQAVSVKIAEDKGLFTGMSDAVTYTIIGIIAVLVLIFLVLVAKVSRKSAKPQF